MSNRTSAITHDATRIGVALALPPAVVVFVVLAETGHLPNLGFAFHVLLVALASFAASMLIVLWGGEDE